jgi:hypothetical protein
MPSPPENLREFTDPASLPADARGIFGDGLFDSTAWYSVVTSSALPPGGRPAILVFGTPAEVVFPMLRLPRGAASLTTPYTCLWTPLAALNTDTETLMSAGRALAAWCRSLGAVRLDCLDFDDPRWWHILRGVRAMGFLPLQFNHFGNWTIDLRDADFDFYMADRPGALRATFKRRRTRLARSGAALRMVRGAAGLDDAIAAFEAVYARSWKPAEPYPNFNAALMRACATDGSLRLALLERAGHAIAAQLWAVRGGTATVLKLAYDEAEKAGSPGTVLTGLAIQDLMAHDRVTRLDFGRGDDTYKRDWSNTRRQRVGLVIANPCHPRGLLAIARHLAGRLRAALTRARKAKQQKAVLV